MPETTLPGTCLRTSRLGFGTASLHRILDARRRQDLLSAAFDAGIRHFDTARYYGHGLGERELGRFAAGRPGVVIATKVGILAAPLFERLPLAMVAAKAIKLGGAARRIELERAADFRAAADRSLGDSLKALRREAVDLLLLHEPPESLAAIPEHVIRWFAEARAAGKARHIGIAGEAPTVRRLAGGAGELAEVLQVSDSIGAPEQADLQISFGYLRAGTKGADASHIVRAAMQRNRHGVVLFSTTSHAHLAEACAVARDTTP